MSRYDIPGPRCNHSRRNGATRVGSHSDLAAAQGPVASAWVCTREACIEDAKEWVYASTHREALVVSVAGSRK